MITVAVEHNFDVTVAWSELIDDQLIDKTVRVIKTVSDQTRDTVQAQMPVDTGWAQARWGHPEYGGIWEEESGGMSITQGSSIEPYEYIQRLNEGYSQQAPAGFIDAAAANAEIALEEFVNQAAGELDG